MGKKKLPRFLYGGDYNPEQWPADTWAQDIQIFKQAVFLKYSADLLMLHTGNSSFIRLLQAHKNR